MTYSIVARDAETGRMGVAVQSHWFSVGSVVSWGEAGVGVVATQSFAERSYGPLGLELMRRGRSAPDALSALVRADEDRDVRQVAFVDASGRVGVHTGRSCIREFGQVEGDGYSVQANMMERDTVWDAMAAAYRDAEGDLPDRLVAALRAGQAEGGDIRGMQSSALLVVEARPTGTEWGDRVVDLRVEDHATPVDELARLLRLWRAYGRAERAEELELMPDLEAAMSERMASLELQPDHPELAFWAAIAMAGAGRLGDARRTMATAHAAGPGWAELLRRIVADRQVDLEPGAVEALLEDEP
ncbi:MAG TPA: DUF1028 domain-containing protein [Actinomycetota bacterium]|jgi:uncharacterized Ntn-hydrolase superfamily protein|nr:DUF1028 domain-containing protein [Actinomycetota bacterium]